MEQKHYTVIVVPEDSSEIKRWTLSSKSLDVGISGWVAPGLGRLRARPLRIRSLPGRRKCSINCLERSFIAALSSLKCRRRTCRRETHPAESFAPPQALTQVNDPARSLAIGPVAGETVREGDVLYASGEKVGSEYESMDSLTANLVDAKLVHVEEDLKERDENLRDLHSFFTRDNLTALIDTVDCANAN